MKISDIAAFDEECLMLVIEDSQHGKMVPIHIHTIHVDRMLDVMAPAELDKLNKEWKCGHISCLWQSNLLRLKQNRKNIEGSC